MVLIFCPSVAIKRSETLPEVGARKRETGGRRPKGEGRRLLEAVLFASKSRLSSLSCRSGRAMPCNGATCSGSQRLRSSLRLGGWSLLWMRLTQACLQSMCSLQSLMERLCRLEPFHTACLRKVPHLSSAVFESVPRSSGAQRSHALSTAKGHAFTRYATRDVTDCISDRSTSCDPRPFLLVSSVRICQSSLVHTLLARLPPARRTHCSSVSRGLTSRIKCVFEVPLPGIRCNLS